MGEEHNIINESTIPFLRCLHNHTVQVIETVEIFREVTNSILDSYQSYLSNKMNEVMKVLTSVATIFVLLTFIAGIYGMNFENMPELRMHWAYPAVWLVMIFVARGMIFFFKCRDWL